MIALADVSRHYRRGTDEIRAVDRVSAQIAAGGFVAFMGPSGSGKSTLLHLIAGIDRPTGGTVAVAGRCLNDLGDDELARWRAGHVGLVFQFFNLVPMLSARRNVALPLLLARMSRAERIRRADTALHIVGLDARLDHPPAAHPGGERRRWPSARAIVTDPALVIADEPTGDLDARSAEDVLGLLRRLSADFGKTVVMVTHDLRAVRFVDAVFHLGKGCCGRAAAPSAPPTRFALRWATSVGRAGDRARARARQPRAQQVAHRAHRRGDRTGVSMNVPAAHAASRPRRVAHHRRLQHAHLRSPQGRGRVHAFAFVTRCRGPCRGWWRRSPRVWFRRRLRGRGRVVPSLVVEADQIGSPAGHGVPASRQQLQRYRDEEEEEEKAAVGGASSAGRPCGRWLAHRRPRHPAQHGSWRMALGACASSAEIPDDRSPLVLDRREYADQALRAHYGTELGVTGMIWVRAAQPARSTPSCSGHRRPANSDAEAPARPRSRSSATCSARCRGWRSSTSSLPCW
ncbi:MAG: ABC transporter ATP-binding protein [Candidatus Binatia bacterium]